MFSDHTFLNNNLRYPIQIDDPVHPELGLVVVIPAFAEPDILEVLDSLWNCQRPKGAVEVIVIINGSETAAEEVLDLNQETFWKIEKWKREHKDRKFNIFQLHYQFLPEQYAGAGLARKIGMDEAIARFEKINNPDGVIAFLDADCTVEETYLCEIEKFFQQNPHYIGAQIYFEHPLKGKEQPKLYDGILRYELTLRYLVHGFTFSRYPEAFYFLGSSMALKYNTAPEDSSILSEIQEEAAFFNLFTKAGKMAAISTTTVFPSPRVSDRLQRGTGKAMSDWIRSNKSYFEVPHPLAFADLKILNESLLKAYKADNFLQLNEYLKSLPASIVAYLSEINFVDEWEKIRLKSEHYEAFKNNFYLWFNIKKAKGYLNYAQQHFYGSLSETEAAGLLLQMKHQEQKLFFEPFLILQLYRNIEKGIVNINFQTAVK